MLLPKEKQRHFYVTYDDGVLQDTRFVALLDKYNLKETFNLNSGLMAREFELMHESGFSAFTAENLWDQHLSIEELYGNKNKTTQEYIASKYQKHYAERYRPQPHEYVEDQICGKRQELKQRKGKATCINQNEKQELQGKYY